MKNRKRKKPKDLAKAYPINVNKKPEKAQWHLSKNTDNIKGIA